MSGKKPEKRKPFENFKDLNCAVNYKLKLRRSETSVNHLIQAYETGTLPFIREHQQISQLAASTQQLTVQDDNINYSPLVSPAAPSSQDEPLNMVASAKNLACQNLLAYLKANLPSATSISASQRQEIQFAIDTLAIFTTAGTELPETFYELWSQKLGAYAALLISGPAYMHQVTVTNQAAALGLPAPIAQTLQASNRGKNRRRTGKKHGGSRAPN